MVNGSFTKFLEFLFTGSINAYISLSCLTLIVCFPLYRKLDGKKRFVVRLGEFHATMSFLSALHRLRFQAFLDSVSDEESANIYSVVYDLLNNFPNEDFQEKLTAEPFSEILDKYEDFVVQESECNPTFSLWSTYLEMIGILLQFVR
jgi:hypothetical protein